MKRIILIIVAVIAVGLFAGCGGMGSQGTGLLSSSGRSGEVLIVCDNNHWKGVLGDSLQSIFMQSIYGLPQAEPMFLLSHISDDRFREAYKKQRNIIYFTIDSSIENPKVVVNRDPWAKPQLLIRITAKNEQQAINTVSEYQHAIRNYLLDSEMKRFQRSQRSNQDFKISSDIKKGFNISMIIPDGFIFAVNDTNFCWLRKDTKDWTQNILIYTQEYTDTNQFKNETIVKLRNIYTRQYVFGSVDSSYAVVDEKYIPTQSEYMALDEQYAIRTVGLWKMEKDFMGGAFVNMSVLDAENDRIITIDGFLYAPANEKRDLLRQLEAIILSTKFKE